MTPRARNDKTDVCTHTTLPFLSRVTKTAVSLQAGRGSNTFIPPGPNHSSAAMFTPLPSPHLISDIVTTVAVRLTAKTRQSVFGRDDVAVRVRLSDPVVSNQRSPFTPPPRRSGSQ